MEVKKVSGKIIDPVNGRIFAGEITVSGKRISDVREAPHNLENYILPPIVDAHIHIESSMLPPESFAAEALRHGTCAVVADPHEIANVLGAEGVDYMLRSASKSRLKFFFGVPSCVPASEVDPAGASLSAKDVADLLKRRDITHLGEMMDIPGVLNGEPETAAKIQSALAIGKPVDGHAPGLGGRDLLTYISAGITTDHESSSIREAREKALLGMKILVREGSAARDLDALMEIIHEAPQSAALCTDDIHAQDLVREHMDKHIRAALQAGIHPLKVFQAASVTPIKHYKLPLGRLQPGDSADFAVTDSLETLRILETWIAGRKVYSPEDPPVALPGPEIINNFRADEIKAEQLRVPLLRKSKINVIGITEGSLFTSTLSEHPKVTGNTVTGDVSRDIIKIVALNRYQTLPPAAAFVHGFGIHRGAIASSIGHDSHNIIAVGVSDSDIAAAVNLVVKHKGGISAVCGEREEILPLPIAGLMSDRPAAEVAVTHDRLDEFARKLGTRLKAPFMTLAFIALPVIPEIKLTTRGLFDVKQGKLIGLFQ